MVLRIFHEYLWECLMLLKTAFPDFNCNFENDMCAKKNEE